MEKTTLYLPEDLKAAVERVAAERGVSEAQIIGQSIRVLAGGVGPPGVLRCFRWSERVVGWSGGTGESGVVTAWRSSPAQLVPVPKRDGCIGDRIFDKFHRRVTSPRSARGSRAKD